MSIHRWMRTGSDGLLSGSLSKFFFFDGDRTESSFAYIQIKCHENDRAVITSDGTIIYFSQKGVVKKYKFDKFNGGSGGWIEPDLNI